VRLVEQSQQSCRLLFLEYVGREHLGTLLALGSTWGASVAAQDASGKTLAANLSVPLTSTQQSNIQPSTCVNVGPDSFGYTYNYCSSMDCEPTVTSGITAY